MFNKWVNKESDLKEVKRIAKEHDISLFKALLLHNRGIDYIEPFLNPSIEATHDPSLFYEANKTASIVLRAVKKNIPIIIYGDYDCDGITSVALMQHALSKLKANVHPYFNNRFAEGYSVCPEGIDEIVKKHGTPSLVITVDNGISGHSAAERARELGVGLIITDHHELPRELPKANAIFHPHLGDYPFRSLAGVGIAFKLIQLVYRALGHEKEASMFLDLVALGTVADVAPLIDENHALVKMGLDLMNNNPRIPFSILKRTAGLKGKVNSYTLGFMYGPMINAQGRLEGKPEDALEVLLIRKTKDWDKGVAYAKKLLELNNQRKKLLEKQTELADSLVKDQLNKQSIVLANEKFHEGVVGLIASRLREAYYRPVLVLTKAEEDLWKGSGRSINSFSLIDALRSSEEFLQGYGGHKVAAGLSIKESDIPSFAQRIEDLASTLTEDDLTPRIYLDGILSSTEVTSNLLEDIISLEPFGVGFTRPKFLIKNISTNETSVFGRENEHIKITQPFFEVILWRGGQDNVNLPGAIDIIGHLGRSNYSDNLQVTIEDFSDANLSLVGNG